jgi:hypothetical protein
LLLMPAAVLIVIILGGLSVDRAVLFGAQRDLVASVQQAANDAAGLGVDVDALRADGVLRYDPDRIDRAVRLALIDVDDMAVRWSLRGGRIEVVAERRVALVFSKGVPGGPDARVVRATASAQLRRR